MEYNQDELVAPSWLDDAFFLNILRKFENDSAIELRANCVLRPGTKAGDHFASVMYRTQVQYQMANGVEKSIDLIMKIKPALEGLKKELLDSDDDDFFGKEMRMYGTILPQMAQLLAGIGEDYEYPRLVYACKEPHTIIVLEDISAGGWTMKGLVKSYEELQPTIRNIAKFHAASVAIEQMNSSFKSAFKCTILETFRTMQQMTDACFISFIHFVRDTLNLPDFVEPLQRFQQQLYDRLASVYEPSSSCTGVLIHGDFHFKNLLHQQRADRIVDTVFVDYQMCCWSSPVVDLFYLIYLIPEQTVKDTHRDEIVHYYHQTLSDMLARLNCADRIPRLIDLQVELLRAGSLELFHYIVFSAFRYIDMSTVDPEQFFLGRIKNPAFEKLEFQQTVRKELPRFKYQGIL
ncbi:uncharacterized protein LOC126570787 [Anopheles aquasalis]|uniref:uncharacterized protein LOC126570787 n=1 Tax=Anopheles aquasalis TaxID=42839 RepID=UPI00215AB1D8|nr:uncharacterized protein LOC126570787 [Anopheles aquasalis]